MNPEVSQALAAAALLGAVVRPLLVVSILFGLWRALARAELTSRRRLAAWAVVATTLSTWLAVVWTSALQGVFTPAHGAALAGSAAWIVVPTALLVSVGLALLMRSPTIAAAIDAAPLWWLLAYQGYRLTGFIFVRLWSQGLLPGYFALPAGLGDMLTGALALVAVAAFLMDRSWARALAYAVNLLGVIDLLNAITTGTVSALAATESVSLLFQYPLVIVPSFGVPLALIVHGLSLWQMRRRDRHLSAVPTSLPLRGGELVTR